LEGEPGSNPDFVHSRFAFVAVIMFSARPGQAQEIVLTGPLKAAPVPVLRYNELRAERLELAASPGMSLGSNDRPSLLAGAEAHYFLWDAFGVGAWGTAAFPIANGKTRLYAIASPELEVVPIVGKAVAFDDAYFKFDLHLLGGPAISLASRNGDRDTSWLPMFGAGFRGFSAKFLSNSLDYRLLFGDPVRHLVTLTFSWWPIPPRPDE
jgi:hypothetical protein